MTSGDFLIHYRGTGASSIRKKMPVWCFEGKKTKKLKLVLPKQE